MEGIDDAQTKSLTERKQLTPANEGTSTEGSLSGVQRSQTFVKITERKQLTPADEGTTTEGNPLGVQRSLRNRFSQHTRSKLFSRTTNFSKSHGIVPSSNECSNSSFI